MLKKIILIIALIFFFISFKTAAQHKIKIVYNPNDCVNCLNNIRKIDEIKSPIQLILQEQYQGDSSEIMSIFEIKKQDVEVLFSDALYKVYAPNSQKSALIINYEATNKQYLFDLASLNDKKVQYINNLSQDTSKYIFEEPLVKFGTEPWTLVNNYIYTYNKFSTDVRIFNIFNLQSHKVVLEDTIIQQHYKMLSQKYKYLKYDLNDKRIKEGIHIAGINSIPNQNKFCVNFKFPYWIISADHQDTAQHTFNSLEFFDNEGNHLTSRFVDQPSGLKEPINERSKLSAIDANYFPLISDLKFLDTNNFILSVYASKEALASKSSSLKKYYLSFMTWDAKQDKYITKRYLKDTLPSVYNDYGYYFSNALFSEDGTYYVLPLSDVVYTIEGPQFSLDLFKEKLFDGDQFKSKYYNLEIASDHHYIYLRYFDAIEFKLKYIKYHIKEHKIVASKILDIKSQYPLLNFVKFDSFDPNYIFVPFTKNELHRIRVF